MAERDETPSLVGCMRVAAACNEAAMDGGWQWEWKRREYLEGESEERKNYLVAWVNLLEDKRIG